MLLLLNNTTVLLLLRQALAEVRSVCLSVLRLSLEYSLIG
jgi:hypothetical protein